MQALGIGPGDEVITPANSFVASTGAIIAVGAVPVFADVALDGNLDPDAVAARVTAKTRAVMPVHLTGRVSDMNALGAIAGRHGLAIVEDAAQAMGSLYDGKAAGAFGHVGCFSAHPLKNFNAAGDAGFLTTDDAEVARKVRLMRNHGLRDRDTVEIWGRVSRMDAIQAAVLEHRLKKLPDVIAARRRNQALYREHFQDGPVFLPPSREIEFNTFHTLVAHCDRRDDLRAFLAERGVGTAVHYPIPIHLQPAAKALGWKKGDLLVTEELAGRILSIPVHQHLNAGDIDYVAGMVREFYQR